MSAAGASTRRGGFAAGCALALVVGIGVTPVRAADVEESPTAEVWSSAISSAAATPATEAPTAAPSPATATIDAAKPIGSSPSGPEAGVVSIYGSKEFTADAAGELRAEKPDSTGPVPGNLANTPTEQNSVATTREIPAIVGEAPPPPEESSASNKTEGDPSTNGEDPYASEIGRYEREQQGLVAPQPYRGMSGIMSDAVFSSPIGVQLQESRRSLSSGEEADGLLVVQVLKDSPAATAGLQAYNHTTHQVVAGIATVAAIVASNIVPPLMLAIPLINSADFGENYDLIVGVDGTRVTNYLDFEDRLRDVRPGEIIYLSVVRDGKRQQIKVFVPPKMAATW